MNKKKEKLKNEFYKKKRKKEKLKIEFYKKNQKRKQLLLKKTDLRKTKGSKAKYLAERVRTCAVESAGFQRASQFRSATCICSSIPL